MVPRPLDRSGVEAQGEAGGEQNLTRTQGGCPKNSGGGVTSPPSICRCRCSAFRPRPADPNRASGEGRDGSDPVPSK